MFVKKIVSLGQRTNKFTNNEESVHYVSFSSVIPNDLSAGAPKGLAKLAGLSSMPEGTKYGNSYIYGSTIEEISSDFPIGADFSEWLAFGEQVHKKNADGSQGEAIPNLYKIVAK